MNATFQILASDHQVVDFKLHWLEYSSTLQQQSAEKQPVSVKITFNQISLLIELLQYMDSPIQHGFLNAFFSARMTNGQLDFSREFETSVQMMAFILMTRETLGHTRQTWNKLKRLINQIFSRKR